MIMGHMADLPTALIEEVAEATNSLAHHAPTSDGTKNAHELVRKTHQNLLAEMLWLLPPGRDRSLARTHIEEAMMRANRAIALNDGPADHVTEEQVYERVEELHYAG